MLHPMLLDAYLMGATFVGGVTLNFLSLPSDPAVTNNALAIQIDFPLVGVSLASFSKTGLPALQGKQKAGA